MSILLLGAEECDDDLWNSLEVTGIKAKEAAQCTIAEERESVAVESRATKMTEVLLRKRKKIEEMGIDEQQLEDDLREEEGEKEEKLVTTSKLGKKAIASAQGFQRTTSKVSQSRKRGK